MRCLLTGVLAVLAVSTPCRADHRVPPPVLIFPPAFVTYRLADCVGGVTTYEDHGRGEPVRIEYHLFADRPPWLDRVWQAFSPRRAP